jgi:hypothetical protein
MLASIKSAARSIVADPKPLKRRGDNPAASSKMPKASQMKLEPAIPAASVEGLTPHRQRLAALQSDLASVDSAVAAELAKAANLDIIHAAVAPARAAVATFDAEQAAGMARWASSQTTGRPTSAGAQRAELVAEVADAEQSSAAAALAQEGFHVAAGRAAAPLPRLRIEIAEVERIVALEDAEPLVARLKDAVISAHSLRKQVIAARLAAVNGADLSEFRDLAAALAKFADAQAVAESIPVDDDYVRPTHTPRYAVEAAAQIRAIMNTPTTFSSAHPVM